MKKKIFSAFIFAVVLSVLLTLFCVPVSAASTDFDPRDFYNFGEVYYSYPLVFSSGTTSIPMEFSGWTGSGSSSAGASFRQPFTSVSFSSGFNTTFTFFLPQAYEIKKGEILQFYDQFISYYSFSGLVGRSFKVDIGNISDSDTDPNLDARFVTAATVYNGSAAASTANPILDFRFTSSSDYSFSAMQITITWTGSVSLDAGESCAFWFTRPSLFVGSTSNAPIYPRPEGGEEVDEVHDLEDEIFDQSKDGMDDAVDILSDQDHFLDFANGIMAAGDLVNTIVFHVPALDGILWISLSLGLCIFIIGVIPSLVSQTERKYESERRHHERIRYQINLRNYWKNRRRK